MTTNEAQMIAEEVMRAARAGNLLDCTPQRTENLIAQALLIAYWLGREDQRQAAKEPKS